MTTYHSSDFFAESYDGVQNLGLQGFVEIFINFDREQNDGLPYSYSHFLSIAPSRRCILAPHQGISGNYVRLEVKHGALPSSF